MNILAIGAHFDDAELGCGGTLINHVRAGHRVHILVATSSGYRDPEGRVVRSDETALSEGQAAAELIGAHVICLGRETFRLHFAEELTAELRRHIELLQIDAIYSHWVHDVHGDHANLARSALMAGRHVPRFLMYRSNAYDSYEQFRPNIYVDISEVMDAKLAAICAHESEVRRVHNTWLEQVKSLNAADGQKVGVAFAESFEAVRYLVSR